MINKYRNMLLRKIKLLFSKIICFSYRRPFLFWGALLFIVFLPLSWPLWKGQMVEGVDMWTSFIRIIAVLDCWEEGALSARWSPTILFGFGYPILNYYAPLFSYFSAGLSWILKNPVIGLNLSLGIIFFLSGVMMFIFSSRSWGKIAGFFSAVFYLYAPFHLLEIYNRGACAEFSVYFFLPLIFWLVSEDIFQPSLRKFLLAAVAIAGLILTHNLMGLTGLILLVGYILFILYSSKKWSLPFFIRIAALFATSLALSACFWLPVIMEKNLVSLDLLIRNGFEYEKHFLNLKTVLLGAFKKQFFLSKEFELRIALLFCVSTLLTIRLFLKRKNKSEGLQIFFWSISGLLIVYIITNASSWLWGKIPPLAFFQFPWRFLVISNFISAFLAGALIFLIQNKKNRILVCTLLSLVIMNIFWKGTIPYHGWRDIKITDRKEWLFQQTPADSREYLPKWVKGFLPVIPHSRIQSIKGTAEIFPKYFIPKFKNSFRVISSSGSVICFYHYYFPGWEVLIDKTPTEIFTDNPGGFIIFFVPPGNHNVTVQFTSTLPRKIGNTISLLTALAVILLFIGQSILKTRKRNN